MPIVRYTAAKMLRYPISIGAPHERSPITVSAGTHPDVESAMPTTTVPASPAMSPASTPWSVPNRRARAPAAAPATSWPPSVTQISQNASAYWNSSVARVGASTVAWRAPNRRTVTIAIPSPATRPDATAHRACSSGLSMRGGSAPASKAPQEATGLDGTFP